MWYPLCAKHHMLVAEERRPYTVKAEALASKPCVAVHAVYTLQLIVLTLDIFVGVFGPIHHVTVNFYKKSID